MKSARAGDETVEDQEDLGNGNYLVVLAPTPKRTEVHAFAHAKRGDVTATCKGPSSSRQALITICKSLQATKT